MSGTIRTLSLALLLMLAGLGSASAGGFGLQVELPNRNDARLKDAFLTVRPEGCVNCSSVTATAEGIVNGQRRSIPVSLELITKDSSPRGYHTYALRRQWPAEGSWALVITAKSKEASIAMNAIVEMTADGKPRMIRERNKSVVAVMYAHGALKKETIESCLKTVSKR